MKKCNNLFWEETINKLLGNKSPCVECLVRPRCTKSIMDKTACKELMEKLSEALKDYETKT